MSSKQAALHICNRAAELGGHRTGTSSQLNVIQQLKASIFPIFGSLPGHHAALGMHMQHLPAAALDMATPAVCTNAMTASLQLLPWCQMTSRCRPDVGCHTPADAPLVLVLRSSVHGARRRRIGPSPRYSVSCGRSQGRNRPRRDGETQVPGSLPTGLHAGKTSRPPLGGDRTGLKIIRGWGHMATWGRRRMISIQNHFCGGIKPHLPLPWRSNPPMSGRGSTYYNYPKRHLAPPASHKKRGEHAPRARLFLKERCVRQQRPPRAKEGRFSKREEHGLVRGGQCGEHNYRDLRRPFAEPDCRTRCMAPHRREDE